MMLNVILTAIQLVIILTLTASVLFLIREYLKIKAILSQMISHKDGEPSQLGMIIDSMAGSAGRTVAMVIKTSLMGKTSAAVRQEQALNNAVSLDGIDPGLVGILSAMPGVKKIVSKNPALLGLLGNVLSGLKNVSSVSGDGGRSGSQVKFEL